MSARVLFRAIAGNLYFGSHCHSLQFGYTFRRGPVHKISQLGIPKNDRSVSFIPKRDPGITTLNTGSRDSESNLGIAITTEKLKTSPREVLCLHSPRQGLTSLPHH